LRIKEQETRLTFQEHDDDDELVLTSFVKTAENNMAKTRVELKNYSKHYITADEREIADIDAV